MPKDKSLGTHPALRFHKENKKNQLNKSKAEKATARDAKLQHRRPDQLQAQIVELQALEKQGRINANDKRLLLSLERDLQRIKHLQTVDKRASVVVTSEQQQRREQAQLKRQARLSKNPTRSVYYDAVFNPYGVPPPGMPYKEVDDADASDSSTTSSVAGIPMPEGTPPALLSWQGRKGDTHNSTKLKAADDLRVTVQPGRLMQQSSSGQEADRSASIQTTYASGPVLRDLVKESARFKPHRLKAKAKDTDIGAQATGLAMGGDSVAQKSSNTFSTLSGGSPILLTADSNDKLDGDLQVTAPRSSPVADVAGIGQSPTTEFAEPVPPLLTTRPKARPRINIAP